MWQREANCEDVSSLKMYHQAKTHWINMELFLLIIWCHHSSVLWYYLSNVWLILVVTYNMADGLAYRFDPVQQFSATESTITRKRTYILWKYSVWLRSILPLNTTRLTPLPSFLSPSFWNNFLCPKMGVWPGREDRPFCRRGGMPISGNQSSHDLNQEPRL